VNLQKQNFAPHERIWLPLDNMTEPEMISTVKELAPYVGTFKIGLEQIIAIGAPQAVKLVREAGGRSIFLDGKFNDIKTTVGLASLAASRLGVEYFNVHASSGGEALQAAVDNCGNAKVLGVTVLTSIKEDECKSIFGDLPGPKVLQFAHKINIVGADGIICSPKEVAFLREHEQLRRLLLVPAGVRPVWAPADDQKRVMTPGEAIRAGADRLVIGRPITKPPQGIGNPSEGISDRVEAAKRIAHEIAEALVA